VEDLLLDTCVVLNLLASGVDLGELARAWGAHFAMTSVAASEVLWLDPLDHDGEREQVEVAALAATGVLTLVTLDELETASFVGFAASVDDGEAATLAVALHRQLRVATDDRRARRLAAAQVPPIGLVRTTDLLRRWAEGPEAAGPKPAEALRSVEARASYLPSRDDPHLLWWAALRSR
jgi:hypothetical protein